MNGMDAKASEYIKAFLDFLREAPTEHNIAAQRQSDADKEIQDILHCIENNAEASESDKVKLSDAQRNIRRARREAKNTETVLRPIVEWADKHGPDIKSLERLLGDVKKAEKSAENRHYIDRTDIIAETLGKKKEAGEEE